jgi:riboflavin synthase
MFTGIVQATGRIQSLQTRDGDVRLVVEAGELDLSDVREGDSIAVGGVCLTALEISGNRFAADVSSETLLGSAKPGDAVNLEKALRLADRLGGHLVSGHVDGIGRVVSIVEDARSQRWSFEVPSALARYIAIKGSVCVDGVSLTVNEVEKNRFGVNLIPHTQQVTTFRDRRAGDAVNIEVDLIARYAERLASAKEEEQ